MVKFVEAVEGVYYALWQGDGTLLKVLVEEIVVDVDDMSFASIKIGDRPIPGIYCQATVIVPGSVTKKVGSRASHRFPLETKFEHEWSEALEILYGYVARY